MELNIYERTQRWKFLLFIVAIMIGAGSLTYTSRLVRDLSFQEREKIRLWAEATRVLVSSSTMESDLSFPLLVIENNTTVPIILADSSMNIITYRNLDSVKVKNKDYIGKMLNKMKEENEPIIIDLGGGNKNYLYYMNSMLLTRLLYFPYIQLFIIVLFIMVSYFAFSSSRKAEQNKVWVGMSKETAHQLGTPTSSLNAWIELLKEDIHRADIIEELDKDAKRLEKITERFSKIGSHPILVPTDLFTVLKNSVYYLKSRSSEKVIFTLIAPESPAIIPVNESLFEWVIENLCKNSMDAMNGKGEITIRMQDLDKLLYLDITDTGRGLPKSKFRTIFRPGYTTKARGWGLGLSLSKRIIENYHSGKIFVHNSEINAGTTIRIILKKFI